MEQERREKHRRGMSWSELPPELLLLVSQRLNDPFDFASFRAVCMQWRTHVAPSDQPPFLPWFLRRGGGGSGEIQFYSLSSNTTRAISVPEVSAHKMVIGHWDGRLLAIGDSPALVNPLTKARDTVPAEKTICLNDPPNEMWHDDDIAGVVAASPGHFLLIWKRRDGVGHQPGAPGALSTPIPFRVQHLHYRLKELQCAVVFKISGEQEPPLPMTLLPESTPEDEHYVVRHSPEELLGVAQYKTADGCCSFAVYRMSRQNNQEWVKTSSIGDRALFLSRYVSFCMQASDFAGLRGNCIYFAGDGGAVVAPRDEDAVTGGCVYRYCLDNARVETCCSLPWSSMGGSWVVPRLG